MRFALSVNSSITFASTVELHYANSLRTTIVNSSIYENKLNHKVFLWRGALTLLYVLICILLFYYCLAGYSLFLITIFYVVCIRAQRAARVRARKTRPQGRCVARRRRACHCRGRRRFVERHVETMCAQTRRSPARDLVAAVDPRAPRTTGCVAVAATSVGARQTSLTLRCDAPSRCACRLEPSTTSWVPSVSSPCECLAMMPMAVHRCRCHYRYHAADMRRWSASVRQTEALLALLAPLMRLQMPLLLTTLLVPMMPMPTTLALDAVAVAVAVATSLARARVAETVEPVRQSPRCSSDNVPR
jgi:hypothetical protein